MARELYSVRRYGRGLSVAIPREVAVSLGIQDMKGNLLCPLVSMDLSPDRSSVSIKPAKI
jgi:hypothetical protein